MSGLI